MALKGRDIISIRDLSTDEILGVLTLARKMLPIAEGKKPSDLLSDKIVAMAFFEPFDPDPPLLRGRRAAPRRALPHDRRCGGDVDA